MAAAAPTAQPDSSEDSSEDSDPEIEVEGRRPRGSATERTLDRAAVEAMPGRSTDDLLRAMPGLHQSAHGGHGKAYQYFLRGFDAVHGSDLAVSLEGIPLNEVSNVHGQGYLDLHFIPAALVRGMDLRPGAWRADTGDFAIAGSADIHIGLEGAAGRGGLIEAGGGTDRSGSATLAWTPPAGAAGSFLIADAEAGEGVGEARAWRQLRGAAGLEGSAGGLRLRGFLLGYTGEFESPGVLREDDLAAGSVGFYDAYPGSGGGVSSRALAGLSALHAGSALSWRGTLYGGWRGLALTQNFTGWYADSARGDGTLQTHTAWTGGARLEGAWTPAGQGAERITLRGGLDGRIDRIAQAEQAVLTDGTPWEDRFTATITQSDVGIWASLPWRPAGWLMLEPGLRLERLGVRLETAVAEDAAEIGPADAWAPVAAPKAALTLFPGGPVCVLAAYGRSFRSPEARGIGDGDRAPVALADSGEIGAVLTPLPWLDLRVAGFGTFISDELIFDHAAARFLTSGRTRRLGIDSGLTARPLRGLRLETDITWSDGRYVADGAQIPYAPRLLAVSGAYADALPVGRIAAGPLAGPLRLTAGLRGWLLGPRPLPDGFASHASGVLDLTARLDAGLWGASLDIDNLLASRWRDGEFLFPSRWDQADPVADLPVRHFTAGAAFAARLALSRRF